MKKIIGIVVLSLLLSTSISVANVKVKEKDTFYIDLEQYSSYLKGHQDYDVSSIKAKMEHGMLSVNIPRKKQEQKLIEIT